MDAAVLLAIERRRASWPALRGKPVDFTAVVGV
jgi:hypothetical protein